MGLENQETLTLVSQSLAGVSGMSISPHLSFLNCKRKVLIPGLVDSQEFGREQMKLM